MDLTILSILFSVVMATYAGMWIFFAVASCFYKPPRTRDDQDNEAEPLISVFIPACNEEKVVGNLVDDLLNQTYSNFEVIVVPHNCSDETERVVSSFVDPRVKVLPLRTESSGKTLPLNHALNAAQGEIALELDADNRLYDKDYLKKAVRYFFPPTSADALQSKLETKNEEINILTKLQCLEYKVFSHIYWGGRNALRLACPVGGTGVFFRMSVLREIGGWEHELTEDFDLFCKLEAVHARMIYAPDVVSWDEKPATWASLFRQRRRWVRGHLNVMKKRFREKRNVLDFLYLTAPLSNLAWYGSNFLMALYFLTGGMVTYWYPPVLLWLLATLTMYSCMAIILRNKKENQYLKFFPAFYVFSFHWLIVFLLSFTVRSWRETKTSHDYVGLLS